MGYPSSGTPCPPCSSTLEDDLMEDRVSLKDGDPMEDENADECFPVVMMTGMH